MSWREKVLVTAAVMITVFYLFQFLVLKPIDIQIESNRLISSNLRETRDQLKSMPDYKDLDRAINELTAMETRLEAVLPYDKDNWAMLEYLHVLALKNRLILSQVQEGTDSAETWLQAEETAGYTLACTVQGEYRCLKDFLRDLEKGERMVSVINMEIRPVGNEPGTDESSFLFLNDSAEAEAEVEIQFHQQPGNQVETDRKSTLFNLDQ